MSVGVAAGVPAGVPEAERQVAGRGLHCLCLCPGQPALGRKWCSSQESKPTRNPAFKREKDRLSHGQCTFFVNFSTVQFCFSRYKIHVLSAYFSLVD